MENYLFIVTLDLNKLTDLKKLDAFLSQIKAIYMMQGGPAPAITEANARLNASVGEGIVELLGIYVYYNIFMGVVHLPPPPYGDMQDEAWQNSYVRPTLGAIFEPVQQENDTYMSYMTWIVAQLNDKLMTGMIGASGGGSTILGNLGVTTGMASS